MPKKNEPQDVLINVDLALTRDQVEALVGAVPGDDAPARKISGIAVGCLVDLVAGGILLPPSAVARMREALKETPTVDVVVEQFEKGVGREMGKLSIVVGLDPAYEGILQEAAQFNGMTIQEMIQNSWDTAWDNGWLYDPHDRVQRVLMTTEQKQELETLLGKTFANGTELYAAVKEFADSASFLGVR